jgi:hypothetical protein
VEGVIPGCGRRSWCGPSAALVVVALLVAAPPALARFQVTTSTGTGLGVTQSDPNRNDSLFITGLLTPENVVANWDVDGLCVRGFVLDPTAAGCIDTSDPNCFVPDGTPTRIVRCARIGPGIGAATGGGNDGVFINSARNDTVSLDTGAGDDSVTNGSGFTDVATSLSTGLWVVRLGAGADRYKGSLGQDVVNGDAGNDTIDPGAGNDRALGGDGNDVVVAGAIGGGNSYEGDAGFDTLDYSAHGSGIFVAAIGTTGGVPGEPDNIFEFERVLGGGGNDSILGFGSDGGPGADVLTGDNNGNSIVGGTGADVIRGFGGNDKLDANDGIADARITCNTGTDTVVLDLRDPNPEDAEACELISRKAVDEEASTVIATSTARVRDGRVRLALRCPRAVGRACAGTLRLALGPAGRRTAGSRRYRIARGRVAGVEIALRAPDAARVRRASRGLVAVATSSERGLKGAETVTRRVTLT